MKKVPHESLSFNTMSITHGHVIRSHFHFSFLCKHPCTIYYLFPPTPTLNHHPYFLSFHPLFNPSTMAKLLALLALCLLPVLSTAIATGNTFSLKGRVYCDTCRCGFETSATTYLAGTYISISFFRSIIWVFTSVAN